MKNLKKILAVLLALVIAGVVFAACSKAADNGDASESQSNATQEQLVMATNAEFPPYEYHDGDKIVGIDAEVAQAIADKLGMELVIEDVAFDSIIPGVQAGKYDMGMAGMTVTDERLEYVNFSTSYAKGVQSVILPENSTIASIDDIVGKKVGVQTSTTGDIYASAPVEEGGFGEENVTRYDNGAVAVQALLEGKVDCVIIDNEPAKSYVAANEGLKILDTAYTEEEYAICFNKDDAELQAKVNGALEELIADGTLQSIVDKYIPAE